MVSRDDLAKVYQKGLMRMKHFSKIHTKIVQKGESGVVKSVMYNLYFGFNFKTNPRTACK